MIKQVQAPKQMQASKQVQRIPYVAAKVAAVKSNQVVTKVKDGITEVRDMFQKVDSAFKKRKEDSQVLAMAISDAESHFAYLESQTQEQIRSTSTLGLARSSRQEKIENIAKDVENFEADGLENLRSLFDEMKISTQQASEVGLEFRKELELVEIYLSEQARFLESMETSLQQYVSQDTTDEMKVAALLVEVRTKEVEQKNAEEKLKQTQEGEAKLDEAIAGSVEELPHKKEILRRLEDNHGEKQIILGRLKNRAAGFREDIAALQTAAEKHLVAFETQNALRTEELESLAVTFQERRAHRDAKYQELQALRKQKGQLDSDITSAETALGSLTALQRQEQAAQEALRAEVHQLGAMVQQTRDELEAAHQTAAHATKDNEVQYQLTCARMTELREAHQLQSTLSQQKHALEEKLSARVRDLQVSVASKEAEAQKEQVLLQENEAQLTAINQSVADTQAVLAQLRLQCTTQLDQHQAQQADKTRLTTHVEELTTQIAEQKQLEVQKRALEQAYAEQEVLGSAAAETLRGLQQELETIVHSVSEARAAQKKKLTNVTTTEAQQQLHEADVESAIAAVAAELHTKHAAEIADLEDCRAQLARGFPEQKERAAMEIQTKTSEVESQRQRLHSTQQAILLAKEQLQQQTEEQHVRSVTYLQKHRSLTQLQALQKHLQEELVTINPTYPTNATNTNTNTRGAAQLQRSLFAVTEALANAEALALQQAQQQALAEALAQAQAAEEDALATARANELANATIHNEDVFPFNLAEEVNIMGPPNSNTEPRGVLDNTVFGTVASTLTSSGISGVFQSPVDTFPVPYSSASRLVAQSTTIAIETTVPIVVAPTKTSQTAKGRNKRKATQSSEILPQPSPPTPVQVVATSTPISDGLTRWERSQPAAAHHLPPPPPPLSLFIAHVVPEPMVLTLPTSLPAQSQTQSQRVQSRLGQQQPLHQPPGAQRPSTNGIAAALSPATEVSATASMDLFDEMSVASRRTTTVTAVQKTSQLLQRVSTTAADADANIGTTPANPTTTTHTSNSSSISTTSTASTPEEIRAARRREKNKAHKQKQKERNKARATTATTTTATNTGPTTLPTPVIANDDEEQSWDLLKAYPHSAVPRTSNNNTSNQPSRTAATASVPAPHRSSTNKTKTIALPVATNKARPPLHKDTTHPTAAATGSASMQASSTSSSSHNNKKIKRNGCEDSWDIFGLPPVLNTSTLPPAAAVSNSSKKYSGKSTVTPATGEGADGVKRTGGSGSIHNTSTAVTATATVTAAVTANTAGSALADKRKYGQISNTTTTNSRNIIPITAPPATATGTVPNSTSRAVDFAMPTGQPSAKLKRSHTSSSIAAIPTTSAATTNISNTQSRLPAPTSSITTNLHRARPHTITTTTTNTATTASNATTLNKKKTKTVASSKDWFDEDAPF